MSSDDFEKRFQRHVEFMLEQQARSDERLSKLETVQLQQAESINRLLESVAGLIQVARIHDKQIDRNSEQIKEITESLREQRETVNALLRVVEQHVSNHP
jgi:hypothetical protein